MGGRQRPANYGHCPPKKFIEVNSEHLPKEFNLKDFTEKLHIKAWDRVARLGRRPWEQAREWSRQQGFKSQKEWLIFMKTDDAPADIPLYPADRSYSPHSG